jgi:hypothetical protein
VDAMSLDLIENPRSYIVLTYITCERMVVFYTRLQNIRLEHDHVVQNFFSPNVCASCEEEEVEAFRETQPGPRDSIKLSRKNMSLNENLLISWTPYMAMEAWIRSQRGNLSTVKNDKKVSLMHRQDAKYLIKDVGKLGV